MVNPSRELCLVKAITRYGFDMHGFNSRDIFSELQSQSLYCNSNFNDDTISHVLSVFCGEFSTDFLLSFTCFYISQVLPVKFPLYLINLKQLFFILSTLYYRIP